MIRWTGLAAWEFEFPFPGSLTSTFLMQVSTYPRSQVNRGVNLSFKSIALVSYANTPILPGVVERFGLSQSLCKLSTCAQIAPKNFFVYETFVQGLTLVTIDLTTMTAS